MGWMLVCCLWGWNGSLFAQVPEEAILGRIETVLRKAEFEEGFSGVVSVSQGNKVLLERSYGWADAEREIPATLDRKFMIASISKSFVAASILKLEEQGKLSTHDMIGKYLPGYPSWASDQISIHHLLTHTSGIRDYINDRKLWFKMRQVADWTPTPDDLVQTFANKPLFFFSRNPIPLFQFWVRFACQNRGNRFPNFVSVFCGA